MKRLFFTIVFSFALAGLFSSVTCAQGVPTSGGGIDLSISNNSPLPGENLIVTARSYSADINSAKVTWTSAGKTLQSGVGLTTLSIQAPTAGKKLVVSVFMTSTDGISYTNSISIGSGSVDMVLESNGYTPPLFKGKIPLVYQNTVHVIAVPHLANNAGVEYDPKTLVYKWTRNGQVLEDQSGYNKQSVVQPGDLVPRPYTLTVDVSTRDGSATVSGMITMAPQQPNVAFYVNDPLYGPLFNKAIIDTVGIGSQKETNILAVPYGFSARQNNLANLNLTWLIDGVEHTELASSQSVVLRAPEAGSGSSNVELDINNPTNFLQTATGAFSASFNATNQTAAAASF